jgi:hypothetical protein
MATIKVADFAYPHKEAPDLDEMKEFLTACRTPNAHRMRSTCGAPRT